jgi:hypothetical protein
VQLSIGLPQLFSDKEWLERERIPPDHPEYNLSIRVSKITHQSDKFKRVDTKSVEMEALRLKRAKVWIDATENSKPSHLLAVIEFRGKQLLISRRDGECDPGQVAWRLSKYHSFRYGKPGLRIISAVSNTSSCDCTLENPSEFLKYLHLIKNNGVLEIRVRYEKSDEIPGLALKESFKLGSNEVQQPTGRDRHEQQESNETIVQLSDRVYNFLIGELSSWNDPIMARFSEWTRLLLAERRLVMKVPAHISKLLNEASGLFENSAKLRRMIHNFIDENTNSYVTQLGIVKFGNFGAVEFRLIGEPGGNDRIYVSWIWERETNLSNYLLDYEPPDTKWRLETWVYSKKDGAGILVGGDEQSRNIINHVLRLLMANEQARELQANNAKIRELGPRIFSLTDEELKKG